MNLPQNETKIKSFLAYRIFFIIFILVIVPLFIYTLALYKAEYTQKRIDITGYLELLANQIEKDIDQNILLKQDFLNGLHEKLQKPNELYKFYEQEKQKGDVKDFYYFVMKDNKFICWSSSEEKTLGKEAAYLKKIMDSPTFLFTTKGFNCTDCFYLSKTVYKDQKACGALIIGFLKKEFTQNFLANKYPFEINFLIVDSFGKVSIAVKTDTITKDDVIVKRQIKPLNNCFILTVNKKYLVASHIKGFIFKHVILLSVIFIFLLLLSWKITHLMTSALNRLLSVMQKIKKGDLNARYTHYKMGFEINYIGAFFNQMMDSLFSKELQIEKEKLEKLNYLQQLKIAEKIQKSLLPSKKLDIEGLDLAFGYNFAKEVGGDFFDFFIKEEKLFFVITDISDKGISACLYALTLRSIIKTLFFNKSNLKEIILEANNLFTRDALLSNMFATAWFGLYDLKTKKLEYSNAGHLPAILKRRDTLTKLVTEGRALGIVQLKDVQVKEIVLEKDDFIFLYTDGIIDAINPENKFFGQKNLEEFIKTSNNLPVKEIIDKLFVKLKNYSKDTVQYDDMTGLGLKIL